MDLETVEADINLGEREAATHPAEYKSLVVQPSGDPYS